MSLSAQAFDPVKLSKLNFKLRPLATDMIGPAWKAVGGLTKRRIQRSIFRGYLMEAPPMRTQAKKSGMTLAPDLPPDWGRVRPSRRRTMRPSRLTDEQIIGLLKEQEAKAATADVGRKHDISQAAFCKGKAEHGGDGRVGCTAAEDPGGGERPPREVPAEPLLDNAILKEVAARRG